MPTPETCRETIASLDTPATPQPPESVIELADWIERVLPNDACPDVRAWALWRVLVGELDELLDATPLEPRYDALAGKGVISITRAITWPAHSSAKAQVEDLLGEQAR